jgi:hypothetical protein
MPKIKIVPIEIGRIRVEKASKFKSDFRMSALLFIQRIKKQSDAIPVTRINLE